jgi:hypothetical protein
MRLCRKLFRPVAGSLMMLVTAVCAPAEIFNHFFPIPPGGASCFTYVFQGNMACNINTQNTSTDPLVNPFAYNGGSSCVSVSYNQSSNTTSVTICGTIPIEPGQVFHYPQGGTGGNGEPHFGIDGTAGTFNMLAGFWSDPPNACSNSGTPGGPTGASPGVVAAPGRSLSLARGTASAQPKDQTLKCATATLDQTPPDVSNTLPVLGVTTTQTPGTNVVYYTAFVSGTDANGNEVGGWFQQAYTAGTTPAFQITNNTNESITISSVGFILNDSLRSLDTLNFGTMPPPGYAGSAFSIPSTSLVGTKIAAGGSIAAPVQ